MGCQIMCKWINKKFQKYWKVPKFPNIGDRLNKQGGELCSCNKERDTEFIWSDFLNILLRRNTKVQKSIYRAYVVCYL